MRYKRAVKKASYQIPAISLKFYEILLKNIIIQINTCFIFNYVGEKHLIFKLKADRYKLKAKHCEVIHKAYKR